MTEPLPGDIFLAPISGWGGAGIKFGEALNGQGFLKVQHAGIYIGNGQTVEAMPGGAIIGDLSRFLPESLVWSTGLIEPTPLGLVELTPSDRRHIVKAAKGYVGVGYSDLDYIALAAHRAHLPIPHLKRYIADSGHMICSQLVDQCYLDAGIHLFKDGRWPGFVDPGALYHLFKNIAYSQTHQGVGF